MGVETAPLARRGRRRRPGWADTRRRHLAVRRDDDRPAQRTVGELHVERVAALTVDLHERHGLDCAQRLEPLLKLRATAASSLPASRESSSRSSAHRGQARPRCGGSWAPTVGSQSSAARTSAPARERRYRSCPSCARAGRARPSTRRPPARRHRASRPRLPSSCPSSGSRRARPARTSRIRRQRRHAAGIGAAARRLADDRRELQHLHVVGDGLAAGERSSARQHVDRLVAVPERRRRAHELVACETFRCPDCARRIC